MERHSGSFWGIPPLSNVTELARARMTESFVQSVKVPIGASSK